MTEKIKIKIRATILLNNPVWMFPYKTFTMFTNSFWDEFILKLLRDMLQQEFVSEVLKTIELDGIKDYLVGIPGNSGLSTEQRKRLTIAVELVANPSIIFMDEPTTGLDARAAAIVMRAVKNVADTGRTIVCTIHQPSIDIFESFDEVKIQAFKSSYLRNANLKL